MKKGFVIGAIAVIAVAVFTLGQPKDKLAADFTAKGRAAEIAGRYSEALEHYRRAEMFADDSKTKHPELHAALLEKMGDMALLTGNRSAARQYFGQSYQAWQSMGAAGPAHAQRVINKVRQTSGAVS